MRVKIIKKWLPAVISICLLLPRFSFSLTLDEALVMARKNLPSYQASKIRVQSTEYLYEASLSPFLPTIDVAGTREHVNDSLQPESFERTLFDATASQILFDGGRRTANRNIAKLDLDDDRQELRKNLLSLQFDVKVAFYTAMARKEALEHRNQQLKDAQKDYEIAEGRFRFGVAKRSDVLQSSVRLEQARFDLRQAEGDLKNAMSDLNSLIGRFLDISYDLDGSLDIDVRLPEKEALNQAALERPEAKQAQNGIEIANYNKAVTESLFYPDFSLDFSYARVESDPNFFETPEETRSVGFTATWNIFELGKFYERKSAKLEIKVSQRQLSEVERQILLEVQKQYEDFITAAESLTLAKQQLKEARFNYEQALGEYKTGKGDILSLVSAESLLVNARLQVTLSKFNLIVAKSSLEQVAGIESLETLKKVGVP
jgi:outer membrane protein